MGRVVVVVVVAWPWRGGDGAMVAWWCRLRRRSARAAGSLDERLQERTEPELRARVRGAALLVGRHLPRSAHVEMPAELQPSRATWRLRRAPAAHRTSASQPCPAAPEGAARAAPPQATPPRHHRTVSTPLRPCHHHHHHTPHRPLLRRVTRSTARSCGSRLCRPAQRAASRRSAPRWTHSSTWHAPRAYPTRARSTHRISTRCYRRSPRAAPLTRGESTRPTGT